MPNIEADKPYTESRICRSSRTGLLRRASVWSSIGATLLLTACASIGSKPPEDHVRQRAADRWQALVAGDISRAYGYNTPGYRAVISPEGFRGRIGSGGSWVGAEVGEINCPEAVKCIARVRIDFKPFMGRRYGDNISTHADETWLLEDGQWWLFQGM
jgi:hypothetical protein